MALSAARIAHGLCCSLCRCAVRSSSRKKTTARSMFVRPAPCVTHCYWMAGKCCNARRPNLAGLPTAIATVTLVRRKSRVYGCRMAILSGQCGQLTAMRVCHCDDADRTAAPWTCMSATKSRQLKFVSWKWKLIYWFCMFHIACMNHMYNFFYKDEQMHLDVWMQF